MTDLETCLRQAAADARSDQYRQWRLAAEADRTGWCAFFAALAGIIVIMTISLLCDWTDDGRLGPIMLTLYVCGMVALPIGILSSWISRKYFADTALPSHNAAITLSLIAVISIFGWGSVISSLH
jgi:hypothetical protein